MSDKCFECDEPAQCNHHIIPKSLGGTKTIPLCLSCHSKVHGKDFVKMSKLKKIGLEKAKKRGIFPGRKSLFALKPELVDIIKKLRRKKPNQKRLSWAQISEKLEEQGCRKINPEVLRRNWTFKNNLSKKRQLTV